MEMSSKLEKVDQPKPTTSKGKISEEMMLKVISIKDKVESHNKSKTVKPVLTPRETKLKEGKSKIISGVKIPSDDNGNVLPCEKDKCPVGILLDLLQAITTKNYQKALFLCKTILLHEPGNEIANEFREVLEELVDEDIETGNATGTVGTFGGKGDGKHEEKNAATSDEETSSSEASESSEGESDDDESSSSSDSESTDSSSEEVEENLPGATGGISSQKLKSTQNTDNEKADTSSESEDESEEETSDTESSISTSSSDLSLYFQKDSTSIPIDPEINDLIHQFTESLYSLDYQDTFDMISSMDFDFDDDITYNGATVEDLGELTSGKENKKENNSDNN